MTDFYLVANCLLSLEQELRHLRLWQSSVPNAQSLCSRQPFCIDTLELHQWLQFIFIPRLKVIMESSGRLPRRCEISPMAEQVYGQDNGQFKKLIEILRQCDRLLSTHEV